MIELAAIEAARARIAGDIVRTPLVRMPQTNGGADVWLKLELLQPVGSFKLRGAANAGRAADPAAVQRGLVTVSAGNMAQGVAWIARRLGVPATIIAPEQASATKLAAVEQLGGTVVRVSQARWWQAVQEGGMAGVEGHFVHPLDDDVMAANGTIGVEILEDLPDAGVILVPIGSGALAVGVASAVRRMRPATRVYACEPTTAAALTAALAAGCPTPIETAPSFIDGAGGRTVLPAAWERLKNGVAGAVAVSPRETAAAMRLLAERVHVIAEGAGALATAAALSGRVHGGPIVCVVSGGNVDPGVLGQVLAGGTPVAQGG